MQPAATGMKLRELAAAVAMSTKTTGSNIDSTEVVAEAAVTVAEASAQLEYKEIRAKERAMEVKEEMEHYLDICYLKKCW